MIIIDKPGPIEMHENTIKTDTHRHIVGTYDNASSYDRTDDNQKDTLPHVPIDPQRTPTDIQWIPNNLQCVSIETLWSIIRNIKSRVSTYASKNDIVFARQGRYHDHIIRNESEYAPQKVPFRDQKIKYYIQTNPANRNTDSLRKVTT